MGKPIQPMVTKTTGQKMKPIARLGSWGDSEEECFDLYLEGTAICQ
jgi:hypothetical protein